MKILKHPKIENSLMCPICSSQMKISEGDNVSLYCTGSKRHSYDFSSSGYVNLATSSQSNGGDSKQAVKARSAFLDKEYYRPVADKLCYLLKEYCAAGGLVVDAGCGEGYYSKSIKDCGFCVAGFDLSKFAVDAAARRVKNDNPDKSFFGVSSVFSLPIFDLKVDAVVNIFAPCVESEYSRVLSENGVLIVVQAGERHLLGLKQAIYDVAHLNNERADIPLDMEKIYSEELEYSITVSDNQTLQELFAMTPYYWKTSREDFEKLNAIENLTTEIDMIFSVYKKHYDDFDWRID